MTNEQFLKAVAVIGGYHTTKVTLNLPKNGFVGNIGATEFNIYVNKCCAGCVNALKDAGFMLSMTDNGLHVDKY